MRRTCPFRLLSSLGLLLMLLLGQVGGAACAAQCSGYPAAAHVSVSAHACCGHAASSHKSAHASGLCARMMHAALPAAPASSPANASPLPFTGFVEAAPPAGSQGRAAVTLSARAPDRPPAIPLPLRI